MQQTCVMYSSEVIEIHFAEGVASQMNLFRSHKKESKVVMVIFPAMGVKGSYYKNAAQHFAACGMHVFTVDHRGHGSSSVVPSRKCNFGYKEQIETEYVSMLEEVKRIFPRHKVVILGHSLGGQMGTMFISRYPHLADGFIVNASCSPFYKGWGWAAGNGLWLFAWLIRLLTFLLGYYPGNRTGFGGREAAGVMYDWCQTVFTNRFSAHGSDFDYNESMTKLCKPVLGITYEGDSSAPPLALRYLTAKLSLANVELHHILPPAGRKKYNHYSWVKTPGICDAAINSWLSKVII